LVTRTLPGGTGESMKERPSGIPSVALGFEKISLVEFLCGINVITFCRSWKIGLLLVLEDLL
jgi:hypothetical protein